MPFYLTFSKSLTDTFVCSLGAGLMLVASGLLSFYCVKIFGFPSIKNIANFLAFNRP